MTWLTWRQFRLPVAAVLAAVVVFAVTLVLTVSGLDVPGTGQDYLAQLPNNVTQIYTVISLVMTVLRGSSASSGARRWWLGSWRPAPTGWCGTRP
ncbi:hypothetical protein GCM10029964_026480 [Kibdelosporangium lantanae]